jgi:hypothetical protein
MFYVLRAKAHVRMGDIENALMDFDYAVRSDRNFTMAYTERAAFHSSRGEFDLALEHLDAAIELDGADPAPYEAKAWLLATAPSPEFRNGPEAVALASRALELTPGFTPNRRSFTYGEVIPMTGAFAEAFIRDTLAAAHAENGEFENAVAEQERAIAILNETGETLGGEQERLALYRSGVALSDAWTPAVAQETPGGPFALGRGDSAEAVPEMRQLAEAGDMGAQYNLASYHAAGSQGVEPDYAEAAIWYRRAADQGMAEAQYNLGVMYQDGLGVEQSDAEAARYYQLSAEQGFADAQVNLGLMHAEGRGVPQDLSEAQRLWQLAAAQGHANAQAILDRLQNSIGSDPHELTFADGGQAYNNGDYATALQRWRVAAEGGHARAQYMLGLMYHQGQGVEKNSLEAARYWAMAAESGNSGAQYNLGILYANGEGVPEDYIQAYRWVLLASQSTSEPELTLHAVSLLEQLNQVLTDEQMAEARALAGQ